MGGHDPELLGAMTELVYPDPRCSCGGSGVEVILGGVVPCGCAKRDSTVPTSGRPTAPQGIAVTERALRELEREDDARDRGTVPCSRCGARVKPGAACPRCGRTA